MKIVEVSLLFSCLLRNSFSALTAVDSKFDSGILPQSLTCPSDMMLPRDKRRSSVCFQYIIQLTHLKWIKRKLCFLISTIWDTSYKNKTYDKHWARSQISLLNHTVGQIRKMLAASVLHFWEQRLSFDARNRQADLNGWYLGW